MGRRLLIAVMLVFIAILTTIALGLMSFGSALAADPVTVKLTPKVDGDVNVIDVSFTNSTTSSIKLDVQLALPAGATFVGATPAYKFAGNILSWNTGNVSAGGTRGPHIIVDPEPGSQDGRVPYPPSQFESHPAGRSAA